MNPLSSSQSRLQQQPQRIMDRQQQSSGTPEFQPRVQQQGGGDKPGQLGEGSYEGSRDYQNNIESYLKTANVRSNAKAAKPTTQQEADELKDAEQEGLSHSKAPGH